MDLQAKRTFCFTVVLLFLHRSLADAEGPVVHLRSGSLRGKLVKVLGTDTVVHTYLGVPFAQPPVGSLRLAPPLPAEPWEGERDATHQPTMCIQDTKILEDLSKNISMEFDIPGVSEDCLYLNVYTPAVPTADLKLPVMVWIHGGGFVLGGAACYDGSALAAYQDAVVVLIQYRLGILGLLSTGDEHCPGNYGLLDQVAALRWVQENIHSFGGDPGLVTIFGESAGGMSVSMQLLSPLSVGLFHHAIAESGTAMIDALIQTNPLPTAQYVANVFGCDNSSSKAITECMTQLSEEDIINNLEKLKYVQLGVVVDGAFLTKPRDEIFLSKEVNTVPFMTGITNLECGWLLPNMLAPPGWVDGMDREQVADILLLLSSFKVTDPRLNDLILDEYLGTTGDRVANRDGCLELMGDLFFTIPAIQAAKYHRDAGAPVYLYEFQQPPSILQSKRPSFTKADHGDELHFIFGGCFLDGHIKFTGDTAACTEEEEKLALTVMQYWGNFARTGSPSGEGLVGWPLYGAEEEYLGLGLTQTVGRRLKEKRFAFMTQTVPERVRALELEKEKEHSEL